jgi:predicted DNA-binding transcriptional regulator AlpA
VEDRLLYRVTEVAVFLNVSRSKVYELLASGDFGRSRSTGPVWFAAPTSAITSSRLGPSPEPSHAVHRYGLDQLIRSLTSCQ